MLRLLPAGLLALAAVFSPRPAHAAGPTLDINSIISCYQSGVACDLAAVSIINYDRALVGVGPLTLDPLMSAGTVGCIGAQGHADHMAYVLHRLAHDQFPADVCGYPLYYHAVGENASAFAGSMWDGMIQGMQYMYSEPWYPGCSSGHICNFRSPRFTHIGIGFAYGPLAGYSANAWYVDYTFSG